MIILISGSINAGKTTVSKALCRLLPRTAHVEVDDLREFIGWMGLEESIPLNLKNAAAVARNFAEAGLNVIVSYPLRPLDYEYMANELEAYSVHCVTLSPPLEVAQRNRGTRELTSGEIDRIAFHYDTGIANPPFGITIDNSGQTPDETARAVLAKIDGTTTPCE